MFTSDMFFQRNIVYIQFTVIFHINIETFVCKQCIYTFSVHESQLFCARLDLVYRTCTDDPGFQQTMSATIIKDVLIVGLTFPKTRREQVNFVKKCWAAGCMIFFKDFKVFIEQDTHVLRFLYL